ncbi:hypothetical protein SODALDRAFT_332934 [Sodiomyces alkalinus F11]|uniref:Protein kinase domain-containing protein n=1 Tax=Sodiomyces alkalinus (strain CBS 110278 / VKM F-3762 / F11) TaxID=1314773 RepID=A0A3N2PVJ5_SODAK|nr:hypothetical protein SODALDRAFT_332934 [Sodiomyces alkalinus F11]ROT38366.1 hypothetical protein SODALDRAFT_332934 [Sodiomyces alkalinus F11]
MPITENMLNSVIALHDRNPTPFFYPANPGEILNNKYELITKVGWGSSSTVWFAREVNRGIWSGPGETCGIGSRAQRCKMPTANCAVTPWSSTEGHS